MEIVPQPLVLMAVNLMGVCLSMAGFIAFSHLSVDFRLVPASGIALPMPRHLRLAEVFLVEILIELKVV